MSRNALMAGNRECGSSEKMQVRNLVWLTRELLCAESDLTPNISVPTAGPADTCIVQERRTRQHRLVRQVHLHQCDPLPSADHVPSWRLSCRSCLGPGKCSWGQGRSRPPGWRSAPTRPPHIAPPAYPAGPEGKCWGQGWGSGSALRVASGNGVGKVMPACLQWQRPWSYLA